MDYEKLYNELLIKHNVLDVKYNQLEATHNTLKSDIESKTIHKALNDRLDSENFIQSDLRHIITKGLTMDNITVGEDGAVSGLDELIGTMKDSYKELFGVISVSGVTPATPPHTITEGKVEKEVSFFDFK